MEIDKQKMIKIVVVIIIAILAIVYYFFNNRQESYENILTNNIIVENTMISEYMEEVNKIKAYITGEVNSPGVIELEEGARIEDLIEGAGGITAQADLKNINLAYEVEDGEKIYIPNISEQNMEESDLGGSDNVSESNNNSSKKININKASSAELTSIPGIGESTAQKIISYREENGKFKTIEDIKKVSGIGNSKYESMKDYISVK